MSKYEHNIVDKEFRYFNGRGCCNHVDLPVGYEFWFDLGLAYWDESDILTKIIHYSPFTPPVATVADYFKYDVVHDMVPYKIYKTTKPIRVYSSCLEEICDRYNVDFSICTGEYNRVYVTHKKTHDTFSCAVEMPQAIIDILTGAKPSWYDSFDIYFGEERKTGRHKVVVKWADGSKTDIYKTDNRPVPTVYALSYAWVERAYGTNSAWKRLVDKHTTHFTYAMDIFEYDTTLYCRSLRVQATKNTKSKSAIDIYDQAAFMLVSQFYGGVVKLNNMVKEAICENAQ